MVSLLLILISDCAFHQASFSRIYRRNRFNKRLFKIFHMLVDGADVSINQPSSSSQKWASWKLNGPELSYKVTVSIFEGHFFWMNRSFKPKKMNDVHIFRQNLKKVLNENEMVCANDGYLDRKVLIPEHMNCKSNRAFNCVKSRQEIFADQLIRFNV